MVEPNKKKLRILEQARQFITSQRDSGLDVDSIKSNLRSLCDPGKNWIPPPSGDAPTNSSTLRKWLNKDQEVANWLLADDDNGPLKQLIDELDASDWSVADDDDFTPEGGGAVSPAADASTGSASSAATGGAVPAGPLVPTKRADNIIDAGIAVKGVKMVPDGPIASQNPYAPNFHKDFDPMVHHLLSGSMDSSLKGITAPCEVRLAEALTGSRRALAASPLPRC